MRLTHAAAIQKFKAQRQKKLLSPAINCVQSKLQMLDQRIIDQCRNHDVVIMIS